MTEAERIEADEKADEALIEAMTEIGKEIVTQDNLATADPMFCVQVLERIGPINPEYGNGDRMYHDHDVCETYYDDRPDPERWKELKALDDQGELPRSVSVGDYVEKWTTVAVCFTKKGCDRHLELNGHNYRYYFGTRIYAESFYRNEEMITIRKALKKMGEVLLEKETIGKD